MLFRQTKGPEVTVTKKMNKFPNYSIRITVLKLTANVAVIIKYNSDLGT